MIRTFLSFLVVLTFFWFFPDIYIWTRNVSNALFQEAAHQSTMRVEVKVTKPLAFLPLKFGALAKGEKNYYVEFYSEENRWAKGVSTESGTALLSSLEPGEYQIHVGTLREFAQSDVRRNEEYGEPLLLDDELLNTTLSTISVVKDVFAVAIITDK